LYALHEAVDLGHAKQVISERVRKEIVESDTSVFETAGIYAGYILFQTATYSDNAKEMINKYVLQLCRNDPRYIGKLVSGFLLDFRDTASFNLNDLRRVYDSRALATLARSAGSSAWSSEAEKRAVEQLLNAEPEPPTATSLGVSG
jgi:hypothetical protein